MKLLRIDNERGEYFGSEGKYFPIDKISKEDLLRLVNLTLQEGAEFDAYDESLIKNQAHQIIYKSVHEKLAGLHGRRQEFLDEADRLFLDEYERYKKTGSQLDPLS